MKRYELILAPVVGWIVAQGLKFIISLRKDGVQFRDLYASGGFPSSHTAFVTPLLILVGLRDGIDTVGFAVMFVVTGLIMYDAIGVRRSVGEMGDAIKELAAKSDKKLSTVMHTARGHSPTEVAGGLLAGILVGLAFYFLG